MRIIKKPIAIILKFFLYFLLFFIIATPFARASYVRFSVRTDVGGPYCMIKKFVSDDNTLNIGEIQPDKTDVKESQQILVKVYCNTEQPGSVNIALSDANHVSIDSHEYAVLCKDSACATPLPYELEFSPCKSNNTRYRLKYSLNNTIPNIVNSEEDCNYPDQGHLQAIYRGDLPRSTNPEGGSYTGTIKLTVTPQ